MVKSQKQEGTELRNLPSSTSVCTLSRRHSATKRLPRGAVVRSDEGAGTACYSGAWHAELLQAVLLTEFPLPGGHRATMPSGGTDSCLGSSVKVPIRTSQVRGIKAQREGGLRGQMCQGPAGTGPSAFCPRKARRMSVPEGKVLRLLLNTSKSKTGRAVARSGLRPSQGWRASSGTGRQGQPDTGEGAQGRGHGRLRWAASAPGPWASLFLSTTFRVLGRVRKLSWRVCVRGEGRGQNPPRPWHFPPPPTVTYASNEAPARVHPHTGGGRPRVTTR